MEVLECNKMVLKTKRTLLIRFVTLAFVRAGPGYFGSGRPERARADSGWPELSNKTNIFAYRFLQKVIARGPDLAEPARLEYAQAGLGNCN